MLKPVIRRIEKWKDLKNYRNYLIAHNLKIKNNYLINDEGNKTTFNTAHSGTEIILLCNLIIMIVDEIQSQFYDLSNQINNDEKINDFLTIENNEVNIEYEILQVRNEIEKIRLNT